MNRLPQLFRWFAAAVFLTMFGLAATSMAGDAPTFDEQGFLVRGLAYLRGEENGGSRIIRVGHPLGLNVLNAALLVNDPGVALPSDDPSWLETSFHRPAELFLWEIGNDVAHVMFLARIPTVWLGLLLAAICARWAAEVAMTWSRRVDASPNWPYFAALLTLLMIGFDPNIMAHMRLVTTDVGLTTGAALAGYAVWRFARRPGLRSAVLAGAALGLLLNTKFNALLFIPWFVLVVLLAAASLWRERGAKQTRRLLFTGFLVIPLVAFLTLWAGHGFQMGPLRVGLPLLGDLDGLPVPLSEYLDQLLDIGNRLEVSTPSFLLGQYSDSGWWYYFPVAFLLKTPLPTLMLLVWAVVASARILLGDKGVARHVWIDLVALALPSGGFFAIALTTDINLGYRHLLPILPFLSVLAGVTVTWSLARRTAAKRVTQFALLVISVGWLIVGSLWIYPNYLAFFNVFAGGPANGWKSLVDSNIDWGQDLGRLAVWLDARGIDDVWLSYFGEARPEYYGIDYQGLDSFPPRLMNPEARPYHPHAPAPGLYAISATTLQGVHFANHDQFAYFREREPIEKIGYSIFLYEEAPYGEPVDLILGDMQVDQIALEDYATLGTNDVLLRWVDPSQAFILPSFGRLTWAASPGNTFHPWLAEFIALEPVDIESGTGEYELYRVASESSAIGDTKPIGLSLAEGMVEFLGTKKFDSEKESLSIMTVWRQSGETMPVNIFIHVLDEAGEIAAQWDGLGVAWEGWRTGDTLYQIHELPLDQLRSGRYLVVAGLYNPENFQRWQDPTGQDVIELGHIAVP